MKNTIKTSIPDADRTKVLDFITQLEGVLDGKLIDLTEEERVKYGSINEQNKLLVNKVTDYRNNSPALSSPDVDWAEFESDYEARQFLEGCIGRLSALVRKMQSTKILHDNDNYQDALDDYSYAQYKRGAGSSDYGEKVSELRQFFNRANAAKNEPPPPAP